MDMTEALMKVIAYHQATKHNYHAYARGPGFLDWTTQPNPFRRYKKAPLINLEHVPPGESPPYDPSMTLGSIRPNPLTRTGISQLFFDSLALSAWKQAGGESWALRVNPSSGNLHPTEGYLICGPVEDLCWEPMVCHYAPRLHALEKRVEFPEKTWSELSAELPEGAFFVGLTSIHWREAWKYGERAFRYCQHDIGHAIAAIAIAAGGLGWQAVLLDDMGTEEISDLLGVFDPRGAETEHPDCLLVVYPQGEPLRLPSPSRETLCGFRDLTWVGEPNRLSPDHIDWPIIEETADLTMKPWTSETYPTLPRTPYLPLSLSRAPKSLRTIIRQRRSAVAMDGRTEIPRDVFYGILSMVLPGTERIPFNTLPWPPQVHLLLFVHRVADTEPGLYLLVRAPGQENALRSAMRDDFLWSRPEACPDELPLHLLAEGDTRNLARELSCFQDIASDGCFSLGMIAGFEGSLNRYGAWFYPRLFWECGLIGQVLYLEAEAAGIRGTGIGCFFDDPVHEIIGLDSLQFQSLYHFTLGGPLEDKRITSLPAYPDHPPA